MIIKTGSLLGEIIARWNNKIRMELVIKRPDCCTDTPGCRVNFGPLWHKNHRLFLQFSPRVWQHELVLFVYNTYWGSEKLLHNLLHLVSLEKRSSITFYCNLCFHETGQLSRIFLICTVYSPPQPEVIKAHTKVHFSGLLLSVTIWKCFPPCFLVPLISFF